MEMVSFFSPVVEEHNNCWGGGLKNGLICYTGLLSNKIGNTIFLCDKYFTSLQPSGSTAYVHKICAVLI